MQYATVKHDVVTDQNVLTDDGRKSVGYTRHRSVAVDNATVLNIAPSADDDPIDLGSNDAVVPDACFRSDGNIADDPASRCDEGAVVDLRRFASDGDDADIGAWYHSMTFQSERCGRTEA